jgi:hypothetical protein
LAQGTQAAKPYRHDGKQASLCYDFHWNFHLFAKTETQFLLHGNLSPNAVFSSGSSVEIFLQAQRLA